MSDNQLKNRIEDLNFWLRHNPNHPDYCIKYQEREKLINQKLQKSTK